MKKIIPVLLVIALICTCFCACGKSEAAKAVIAQIDAIGEVNLDKLSSIEEAEKAYALLSGEDKGDIKNYEKLVEARQEYTEIKEFSDKIEALSEKYDKVFSEYGIKYTEITEELAALKAISDSAEGAKKEQYETMLESLSEKDGKYNEVAEAANKSAVSYIKGFLEVNKDSATDITVKDIGCIAQISDGTTYYLFAMVYEEGAETKKVYSSARFAGTPSLESMLNYAENFYSDVPTSEKTDALETGNVLLDVAAVLQNLA